MKQPKLPYNMNYLCPLHKSYGAVAATCERCYSLALGQQRRQWERERDAAHQIYLATLMLEAA